MVTQASGAHIVVIKVLVKVNQANFVTAISTFDITSQQGNSLIGYYQCDVD